MKPSTDAKRKKQGTSKRITAAWDREYALKERTNWELLPLDDELQFILRSGLDLSTVRSVLEIGCGRGYRLSNLVLGTELSLRTDVSILGLDLSRTAIDSAKRRWAALQASNKQGDIVAKVEHTQADFLKLPANLETAEYDLVIDWMCFHDLSISSRKSYVRQLSMIAREWFVINVFWRTVDRSEVLGMAVPGVHKHQFTDEMIAEIFDGFQIVYSSDTCVANQEVPAPHTDGPVAAKRAYLLRRAQSTGENH